MTLFLCLEKYVLYFKFVKPKKNKFILVNCDLSQILVATQSSYFSFRKTVLTTKLQTKSICSFRTFILAVRLFQFILYNILNLDYFVLLWSVGWQPCQTTNLLPLHITAICFFPSQCNMPASLV